MRLYLDLETYSETDIKAAGTYVYSQNADVLLFAYAIDNEPVQVWDVTQGEQMPVDLAFAFYNTDCEVYAHNAQFDRKILENTYNRRANTKIPLARWRCTMAQALSHALPASLDVLGSVLELPQDKTKLKDGSKLVQKFCKPAPKNHKAQRYDRDNSPDEWDRFIEYARQDVEALRIIAERLPACNWQARDIAAWHYDQQINDRGFEVDIYLVSAALASADDLKATDNAECKRITNGAVKSVLQRAAFKDYLNENFGLDLADTQASTLRALPDVLPDDARKLVSLALNASKTSIAKYQSLFDATSKDKRFRGGLQFRGASRTRRWSGRKFQPQNLPSRGVPEDVDDFIAAFKANDYSRYTNDLPRYLSAALRGAIVAPKGKKLCVADLSNIEGRILAWIAGETSKLDAFRAFDKGEGPDLYNITATSILGGDPYDVPKHIRNAFGKVPDLACGYGGGFGAFQNFTKAFSVTMAENWDVIQKGATPDIIAASKDAYRSWGRERNPEAKQAEWIATEVVKRTWRARHPNITKLWYACEDAARQAIARPGVWFSAGPLLRFKVAEKAGIEYLLCRLPSRACLVYTRPRISVGGKICYEGRDTFATGGEFGKWSTVYTYGGKLVENACQSIAYDILSESMQTAELYGFKTVLTVHDEIVAETMADKSVNRLSKIMATPPEWAKDLPLAAEGFECERYRK